MEKIKSVSQFYKGNNHRLTYENDLYFIDILYLISAGDEVFDYKQEKYHNHTYYEVHLVTKGESEHQLKNREIIKLKKGDFIIYPPGCKHRIINEPTGFSKLLLAFEFVVKEKQNPQTDFYYIAEMAIENVCPRASTKSIRTLGKKLINLYNCESYEKNDLFLFSAMSLIIEMFGIVVGKNSVSHERKFNDERINLAIEYIKQNISASLSVSDVADYLYISTRQITRLFEKTLNISPGNYIKNYRMERIRNMLLNVNLSLDKIADSMGYNDVSSLIKAFKRVEGITPAQYRKDLFTQ